MRAADRRRSLRSRGRIVPGRGFTLIEVAVALLVVSIGMLGVIQAVGQTASDSAYLREKTLAHWVALNRLTEVRLERSAPKIDKTSDEVEMAGRRWKWSMTVTQTPVETIRRIDISVRPLEADEASSLASVSGFYGTALAQPGSALIAWEGTGQGPPSPGGGDEDEGEDGEDGADPPTGPGKGPPPEPPPEPPPGEDR